MLEIGIRGEQSVIVDDKNAASAVGSGMLPVFATPMMIALMEKTAAASVQPLLEAGQTTVGTQVQIRHTSATPLGMAVRCESELIGVDDKRLTFAVAAYDACGRIGDGQHERCIVSADRFLARTNAKRESAAANPTDPTDAAAQGR